MYTGSAGQDLHRYVEGPSAYLNGPPNLRPAFVTRTVSTLERAANDSPRGKVAHGRHTGPAQFTVMAAERKMACSRSAAGPDPYGLFTRVWSPRAGQRSMSIFAAKTHGPANAMRQPFALASAAKPSQAFDPYRVNTRNEWHWRQESPSIRSIYAHPMPQSPSGSSLLPVHQHPLSRPASVHSFQRPATSESPLRRSASTATLPSSRMLEVQRMAESFGGGGRGRNRKAFEL